MNVPGLDGITYMASYTLAQNDCMTFATDTAKLLAPKGLKVPVRGAVELPLDYVRRLIDSN